MGKVPEGGEDLKKIHRVEHLAFEKNTIVMKVDGKNYAFPLKAVSRKLLKASSMEREKFEISHSGYGIHWPLIDEDLSIDALLGIEHELPDLDNKKIAV
jgi:hypothetical protein